MTAPAFLLPGEALRMEMLIVERAMEIYKGGTPGRPVGRIVTLPDGRIVLRTTEHWFTRFLRAAAMEVLPPDVAWWMYERGPWPMLIIHTPETAGVAALETAPIPPQADVVSAESAIKMPQPEVSGLNDLFDSPFQRKPKVSGIAGR